MNTEEIKKLLPHRDPFLFIDKVNEISMEHVVAERFVSPNEIFF
jgi:3-hydroxymyristoyl/3-hydroxydecanoyl-(acyl carrier protein) dehydratases